MALEIRTRDSGQSSAAGKLVADRELCLTADKQTVVEAGDERAAWVLCARGREIQAADVARLGLTRDDQGRIIIPGPAQTEPPTAAQPAPDVAPPLPKKRR